MMKNFILLGGAGYIAPKHFKAIKDTKNNLVAFMDLNDSVGIIDSFFPDADFLTSQQELDQFYKDTISQGKTIDYMSICTPNYLHYDQIKWGLERNINVICEKPLVLRTKELESLKKIEINSSAKVYSILQLRLHQSIVDLKKKLSKLDKESFINVKLTYITSRGKWYRKSWKNNPTLSGGVAFNIGVHFFDMLGFIFGPSSENKVISCDIDTIAGMLEFKNAAVNWFLSIDPNQLPNNTTQRTYRSIEINDKELEFSDGFTELHTESYKKVLRGNGYGIDDCFFAIQTVEEINKQINTRHES